MRPAAGNPLVTEVLARSAGEVFTLKDELIAEERASRAAWEAAEDEERAAILLLVRETLLRLLQTPAWIPGSVTWRNAGRLDVKVSFVVDLAEKERLLDRLLAEKDVVLKEAFVDLLKDLKA